MFDSTLKQITKIVMYLRLSRPKKGKNKAETIADAYGIEFQRATIQKFAEMVGAKIIAEFVEIESGKDDERKELNKAIHKARMHKATLVIGKQDRLARKVSFISNLMDSGVDFISADRPNASKMEVYFRAIVDEEERNRISQRTKDGLATARRKGKLLGSARPDHWKGREHKRGFKKATQESSKARTRRALDAYQFVMEIVVEQKAAEKNMAEIADHLNELGHVTTAGQPFTRKNLHRIVSIFEREGAAA